jgi:rhodanese-related sulfurtransferase
MELKIGLALLLTGLVVRTLLKGHTGKEVSGMVENGALVVDVRTAGEFSGGHIEGAINIPYDRVAQKLPAVEADQSRPIVVYCLSGSRSSAAKRSLEQAGYTNVVNGGSYHSMRRVVESK